MENLSEITYFNTYLNTGISLDTAFVYRVCAYNTAGNSGYSNEFLATDRWKGIANGVWTNGANWNGGTAPGSSTYVIISQSNVSLLTPASSSDCFTSGASYASGAAGVASVG
jgi:hypothetical protein